MNLTHPLSTKPRSFLARKKHTLKNIRVRYS